MASIDSQGRPQDRQGLRAWYSSLLTEQESSGLSVAEYAEALGLTARTLHYWKRRLSAPPVSRATRSRGTPAPADGLIRLALPQRPVPSAHAGFVVRLGGGRRVEVPADFDDEALQRLLAVLERC